MYSIVIPYLSKSKCIDKCKEHLKKNSKYEHELIEIIDETDVYYAFNKGVYQAKYDTVVMMNDDMLVGKNWDEFIPLHSNEKTILTCHVVEPFKSQRIGPNYPLCIHHDCGDSPENFDENAFNDFVESQNVAEIDFENIGWFMPIVVNKKSFVTYPNIQKFPHYPNDAVLVMSVLPYLGYSIAIINSFVYHFSRQSSS
jgi:hypothetical protein